MPIYEYKCKKCGHCFEEIQSFSDEPCTICPECRKPTLHKIISSANVHYKGPGFYTTESRGITGGKRKPDIKVGNVSDLSLEEREKHLG